MKKYSLLLISALILNFSSITNSIAQSEINSLAFGSCLRQNKPVPIFDAIVSAKPDIFIFMGDNVYADTISEKVMRKKYKQLSKRKEFKNLRGVKSFTFVME